MSTVARSRVRSSAFNRYLQSRYFGPLDGLRALSVVAVIWHHTAGAQMGGLLGRGDLGVDFFFAISGFLITTLLLREQRARGVVSLRSFYRRRVLRIFPLYYAVLAAYVVLTLALQRNAPEGHQFINDLPAFLTYTSNWFVTDPKATFFLAWSLATEEQFYVFWPVVLTCALLIARRRGTAAAALVLAALMVADVAATALGESGTLGMTILTSVATPICVGALLAIATDTRRGFATLTNLLGGKWTGVVLLVLIGVLAGLGIHRIAIGVVMAFAVTACCISDQGPLARLLESQPLRFIGVVSYGMYLLHVLIMNAIERALHTGTGVLLFVVTLAVTVVAAWLSFRYFETPIRNLGRTTKPSASAPLS